MRILIGYDSSPCADAALDDLLRAGLPASAEAMIVSVADLLALPQITVEDACDRHESPWVRSWRATRASALREASDWAEQGAMRLRAVFPGWHVDVRTQADSPGWAVINAADTWKADLVVVGSHGRSALGRAWFGSVAQSVLHHAKCDVRIGRGRGPGERAGAVRLVVGVDGSAGAEAAVSAVAGRAWPAGSAVRVVTAVSSEVLVAFGRGSELIEPVEDAVRRVNAAAVRKLETAGLDAVSIIGDADPKRALVQQAAEWGADAVFVGRQGLRARRSFLGSVVASVAARAPCSVEAICV
jgi:nucleotide-binding universal stress UspA family protein